MWQRDDTRRKVLKAPISEKAIECIYIGLNASSKVKDDIEFEVKQKFPSAKIFQAEKRSGVFGLDFREIT